MAGFDGDLGCDAANPIFIQSAVCPYIVLTGTITLMPSTPISGLFFSSFLSVFPLLFLSWPVLPLVLYLAWNENVANCMISNLAFRVTTEWRCTLSSTIAISTILGCSGRVINLLTLLAFVLALSLYYVRRENSDSVGSRHQYLQKTDVV